MGGENDEGREGELGRGRLRGKERGIARKRHWRMMRNEEEKRFWGRKGVGEGREEVWREEEAREGDYRREGRVGK